MSILQNLKRSASARKKVVLLPDDAFFLRVVPLPPGTQPADVPAQVELALEGLSPFSVAQLCYGYYVGPNAGRVLVYAAYRRRFTVEDAKVWAEAERLRFCRRLIAARTGAKHQDRRSHHSPGFRAG